jgi:hypothetical protein
MRWALIFAVAAACGGTDTSKDCKADREAAIDRSCVTASDCVLVRSADCCGTILIGVRVGTEGGFSAVETAYEQCLDCPPLGCQHADEAEDGSVAGIDQTIIASCEAGGCTSRVAAAAGLCAASGSCSNGPACGGSCCGRGEHCENGMCRCGTQAACGSGDSCEAAGPIGGDACGAVCCGVSGPCPQ